VVHTQSRTAENDLLLSIMGQNFVEMHVDDANALGIKTGDQVRVSSRSNPDGIVGHAKVGYSVRPGVVAIANSFGHWQYGSQSWKIGGEATKADPKRGRGLNSNLVMRVDESIGNVGLQDLIGGSASYYDTRVNVQKA
jgi:anaerobic selenocysteine-containing dehydrogenase